MVFLYLLLLVFQAYCHCQDVTQTASEWYDAETVQWVDFSVKERLVNALETKFNETLDLYEANSASYSQQCEVKVDSLGAECQQCAEKACEPSDLEKVKLFLKKGVKEVGKGLKKTAKEAARIVIKAHEAVKKIGKKISSGAKKVVKGVVKGVRKVVRKVTRVVRRVVRSVTRVVRRVTGVVRRVARIVRRIRIRIPRPRIRIRFRRWGKRNAKRGLEPCALECSSCQRYQAASDTDNYDDICGPDVEGDRLLNKLKEFESAFPSDTVPIVTQITKETRSGKEQTVVYMYLDKQPRQVLFPVALFGDLEQLITECYNKVKSYEDLLA